MQDMTQLLLPFPQTFQTEKELGNVNLRGFLGKGCIFQRRIWHILYQSIVDVICKSLLNDRY